MLNGRRNKTWHPPVSYGRNILPTANVSLLAMWKLLRSDAIRIELYLTPYKLVKLGGRILART